MYSYGHISFSGSYNEKSPGKVVEKIKNTLFALTFSKNRVFRDIMWENIVELDRTQMTTCCMRSACWIHRARDTHSENATLIALPLQQSLHESA
jgi:hypothetical protein